ncbi:MAG TPA: methyltransferase domain-containing protein [Niabella sp.]|nr:methyltransferase domain-containing protein [Niabella sp.]
MFSSVIGYYKKGKNYLYKFIKRSFIKGHHQLTNTTAINRYPEIFLLVKRYFESKSNTDISFLSYGCSTGEECFSLNDYFPKANIIGVDIYGPVLRKAESANKFNNIRFMLSNETNITSAGPFDTIFAMSVLCRWEDTKGVDNCSQIYPFRHFEETLELLDKNLNVGGLLVIYNSNYLFRDSAISKKYRPLFGDEITGSGFVHKFKKTGERELQEYKEVIFQKTT